MNILILGSGGREHALAWKISQSSLCKKLFIAPGNAGTDSVGENVSISVEDFPAVRDFIRKNEIDIVVVGPEIPLVKGIADFLKDEKTFVVGPNKNAAQLEGSKDFAKHFMQKYGIPTARFRSFQSSQHKNALIYLEKINFPVVLKADGLAAGKGVVICENPNEAKKTLKEIAEDKIFGEAGNKIVIEEFLKGIEFSVFILSDGEGYALLPEAKDYKRIGEGDTGLNTGGMGAVSPVPFVNEKLMEKVERTVIEPTMEGLKKEKINYLGFLYFGLMLVKNTPYVLEYNCRLGDPETEAILPRIESDFVELMLAMKEKKISEQKIKISTQACATVVLASGGYPGNFEKGKLIEELDEVKEGIIFHAGTLKKEEKIYTNGGRVLAVTSLRKTINEAVSASNRIAQKIHFEKKYFRRDIGREVIN